MTWGQFKRAVDTYLKEEELGQDIVLSWVDFSHIEVSELQLHAEDYPAGPELEISGI